MEPVAMACPNCGAGLGPASASGEYVCAYCKHVAQAPRAVQRAVVFAQISTALAANTAQQARSSAQRDEVKQRLYAEDASGRRNGAIFVLVFGVGAIVSAGVLVEQEFLAGAAITAVLGALFVALGVYNLRYNAWLQRMRATGVSGRGIVTSYKERGSTSFDLTLRIEIPGREPYEVVKKREYTGISGSARVATGAELPVRVAPENPSDVMIEWF
jgi:hypothetical protein